MGFLLKGGYLIDPASNKEGIYDVLVVGEHVAQVEPQIQVTDETIQVINCEGKYIMPGFIDLHVHLREPGFEYKETIQTGTLAAAAGGFTSICPMPNTNPAIDTKEQVTFVLKKAKEEGVVNVLPVGAVSLGQKGDTLANIKELMEAGVIAISEDGKSVMDTHLYYQGMKEAARLGIPVFAHCEDKSLVRDGVVNEGDKAKELGLPEISNAVEDIITARDIFLSKASGAHLHLCHISTGDSVKMLAMAKDEGLSVTGEACPHHFILTDEDIPGDDANYKMNPPLRSNRDVEIILKGLREDIIDVIATDHAPHSEEEKRESMKESPFGIVGLETAFSLTWTALVKTGVITPRQMVEKMSVNPAKIIGIDKGSLDVGKVADIVIADPEKVYTIDKEKFFSKGKNTPFHGKEVVGQISYTFVGGKLVYQYHK